MLNLRISLSPAACAAFCGTAVHARTHVQRDVESYAIATCLVNQADPFLKDQGDAWASVIVQRSHGEIELFHPVQEAVEAELKKGNIATIHQESDPKHPKLLPVLYCAEIVDEADVLTAIDKAVKKLGPAYRRAKK